MLGSLTSIKTDGARHLYGCPALLHVWIVSHLRRYGFSLTDHCFTKGVNLVRSFIQRVKPIEEQSVQYWIDFFGKIQSTDIEWTAVWMGWKPITIGSDPSRMLPLIGFRYCTSYQPCRVVRQIRSLQRIPPITKGYPYELNLTSSELSIDQKKQKRAQIYQAWAIRTYQEFQECQVRTLTGTTRLYQASPTYILYQEKSPYYRHTGFTASRQGAPLSSQESLQDQLAQKDKRIKELEEENEMLRKKLRCQ